MSCQFTSFHSQESFFYSRLYIKRNSCSSTDQEIAKMKEHIFANGKERKGLGMTEYPSLVGRVLTYLGYAFKTTDESGKTLYINKKSFCNLLDRLSNCYATFKQLNPESIEAEYHMKKDKEKAVYLKKLYEVFEKSLINFSNNNIGEISQAFLDEMTILKSCLKLIDDKK